VPHPNPGEALVQAEVTLISPGTELRCLAGNQTGTPGFPFIPGYSMVGLVAEGTRFPTGTRVYCDGTQKASVPQLWGGHCSYAVLPEDCLYAVPEGMGALEASFAHLAAIAMRGIKLSRPIPGEKVAVVGLGPIGMLALRQAALTGADVLGLDLDARRVEAAGAPAAVPNGSLREAVCAHFGSGADVVIDATGVPAVLREAVRAAREKPWGNCDLAPIRIVLQGTYAGEIEVPYDDLFYKEAQLLVPRDAEPRDKCEALDLIASGALRVADLATEVVSPDDAPRIYRALSERSGLITAAFSWM